MFFVIFLIAIGHHLYHHYLDVRYCNDPKFSDRQA